MRISQYTDVWSNPIVVIPVDKTHAALCQHVTAESGIICTNDRNINDLVNTAPSVSNNRVYIYNTIFCIGDVRLVKISPHPQYSSTQTSSEFTYDDIVFSDQLTPGKHTCRVFSRGRKQFINVELTYDPGNLDTRVLKSPSFYSDISVFVSGDSGSPVFYGEKLIGYVSSFQHVTSIEQIVYELKNYLTTIERAKLKEKYDTYQKTLLSKYDLNKDGRFSFDEYFKISSSEIQQLNDLQKSYTGEIVINLDYPDKSDIQVISTITESPENKVTLTSNNTISTDINYESDSEYIKLPLNGEKYSLLVKMGPEPDNVKWISPDEYIKLVLSK